MLFRSNAAYEIYAHIAVAEREGMPEERLASLVANLKPADLSDDESVAFDVAYALSRGGTLVVRYRPRKLVTTVEMLGQLRGNCVERTSPGGFEPLSSAGVIKCAACRWQPIVQELAVKIMTERITL